MWITIKKEDVYRITSWLATGMLAMGVTFAAFYLVLALLGRQWIFLRGVLVYLSFAGMGLAMRYVLKRVGKEMRLGLYEHIVLLGSYVIFGFIRFKYPYNIIFTIIGIIMMIISYRANKRAEKKEMKRSLGDFDT